MRFIQHAASALLVSQDSQFSGQVPRSPWRRRQSDLQEIHHAETKAAAQAAIKRLQGKKRNQIRAGRRLPGQGRGSIASVLRLPRRALDHLRTSNPIESVFATVRHRTVRTKGALSQKTVKIMVFTLIRAAFENLAQIERRKSVASTQRRRQIRRWHRSSDARENRAA